MKSRIILVSNDSDFFEYIFSKLLLRKNDEILRLKFDEIPENLEKLHNSLLIINSENFEEQTLALMDLCFQSTNIIFAFNEILQFKINVYKKGAFCSYTRNVCDFIKSDYVPVYETNAPVGFTLYRYKYTTK